MENNKTLKVGREEIPVDYAIYTAANREFERMKKKRQRLRKDGLDYEEKSLDAMYEEFEFEPAADVDVAETVVAEALAERIWNVVNETLGETDAFIVSAYYREKLTEAEIAKVIGISQQAVSKRRKKAEAQLKTALEIFF